MKNVVLISMLLSSFNLYAALDDLKGAQVRLTVGQTNIKPTEVNDTIKAQGLQPFLKNYGYGVEITKDVLPLLNLGLRFEGKYTKVDSESSASVASKAYYSSIQSEIIDGVFRIDIVNAPNMKLDLMGSGGFASNTLEIHTTTSGEGNFTRANLHAKAGASIGFGFMGVFLMAEGGYEWNNMGGPTRNGTTPASIDRIDLSGPYASVGFIFTGDILKAGGAGGGGSRSSGRK